MTLAWFLAQFPSCPAIIAEATKLAKRAREGALQNNRHAGLLVIWKPPVMRRAAGWQWLSIRMRRAVCGGFATGRAL